MQVEQLKRWIGTPYARKYVEAGIYGDPEAVKDAYNDQFLDCCGLLRQASQVRNLSWLLFLNIIISVILNSEIKLMIENNFIIVILRFYFDIK